MVDGLRRGDGQWQRHREREAQGLTVSQTASTTAQSQDMVRSWHLFSQGFYTQLSECKRSEIDPVLNGGWDRHLFFFGLKLILICVIILIAFLALFLDTSLKKG